MANRREARVIGKRSEELNKALIVTNLFTFSHTHTAAAAATTKIRIYVRIKINNK
jgi:hypothetical protein